MSELKLRPPFAMAEQRLGPLHENNSFCAGQVVAQRCCAPTGDCITHASLSCSRVTEAGANVYFMARPLGVQLSVRGWTSFGLSKVLWAWISVVASTVARPELASAPSRLISASRGWLTSGFTTVIVRSLPRT